MCTELIDATDWLPTLYHLAGGDAELVSKGADGMNVWETIANDAPSPREEILHNIDPRLVSPYTQGNIQMYAFHNRSYLDTVELDV